MMDLQYDRTGIRRNRENLKNKKLSRSSKTDETKTQKKTVKNENQKKNVKKENQKKSVKNETQKTTVKHENQNKTKGSKNREPTTTIKTSKTTDFIPRNVFRQEEQLNDGEYVTSDDAAIISTDESRDVGGSGETFKIGLWNAGGLQHRLDQCVHWMEINNIALTVVTETWYSSSVALPRIVRNTSCTGRPTNRRYRGYNGISIIINPFMENVVNANLNVQAKDNADGKYVIFSLLDITVVAIYCPPPDIQKVDEFISGILSKHEINAADKTIILGDFNCRLKRWNDRVSNIGGLLLDRMMSSLNLSRMDTGSSPTFSARGGTSIVDHIFSNISGRASVCDKFTMSDHFPIVAEFSMSDFDLECAREKHPMRRIQFEFLKDEEYKAKFLELAREKCNELLDEIYEQTLRCQTDVDHLERLVTEEIKNFRSSALGERESGSVFKNFQYLKSERLTAIKRSLAFDPLTREIHYKLLCSS